jgi:DNA-binding XRE family transcriptional regulator
MGRRKLPAEQKFWKYVDKSQDCWLWMGATAHGYGSFTSDGKTWRAHRLSYLWAYGELPNDLDVLHSCDTPPCVNPDHLFLGTQADNMADMATKGRSIKGRSVKNKTHIYPNQRKSVPQKLTADQVCAIRRIRKEEGMTTRKLGKMFNVHHTTIGAILRGEYWSHVTKSQHDVGTPAD